MMRIEVIKTPKGRAIKAGEIYSVDLTKKHWMCRILGLDPKFGFNRDFLGRALYDAKGKAGGYLVEGLKAGDIIEEAGGSGKKVYREYARVIKVDDAELEFEYLREDAVKGHFNATKGDTKTVMQR